MKIYLFLCLFLSPFFVNAQSVLPFNDSALPVENRVQDLLKRLTLQEKVLLMCDYSSSIPRLGIKKYNWWNEALHGVGRAGLATVFPQAIGMAATFDDLAVEEAFECVSDEARAKYHHLAEQEGSERYQGLTFWTPNVNIFRDPRWGRGQETYGEDPYLTSRMGLAVVRGLQGPADGKYDKLHACAKHFAVHSGPEWNRHSFNAENISPRDLWETYLPAFKTLVQEGGVKEVMCAYNRFEGEPCCGSNRLLYNILRAEWGFDGLVVSDCGAISDFYIKGHHETHPTQEAAAASAVKTGTDLDCGLDYMSLAKAVEEGLITESQIDVSLSRLLKARFELGVMDEEHLIPWSKIPYTVVDCEKHREKALEMARKSMTLLKNSNGILPLSKNCHKIAVIGPNANDSVMMWGNYNGFPSHTVTILEGITRKVSSGRVIYDKGCELTASETGLESLRNFNPHEIALRVEDAEVIIFVGGLSPQIEGEEMPVSFPGFKGGDRTAIELPQIQRELLKELHKTGKPVILVLCSGSALGLSAETEWADAILQAWYPGQAGGTAVADVLFGDYNPAGRLPVTFYKGTEQLPDYENYNMRGRTYRYFKGEALFPFGYGLSYTSFETGKAKLSKKKIHENDSVNLELSVKNTGKRDGDEVIQVYIRKLEDTEGPIKSLRAYKRIHLRAGEKKHVTVSLRNDRFEFFDAKSNTMRVMPGKYEILYGTSSKESDLRRVKIEISKTFSY